MGLYAGVEHNSLYLIVSSVVSYPLPLQRKFFFPGLSLQSRVNKCYFLASAYDDLLQLERLFEFPSSETVFKEKQSVWDSMPELTITHLTQQVLNGQIGSPKSSDFQKIF